MGRNRYSLLVVSLVVAAVIVVCVYLSRPYPPGPGVRWDNFRRIEDGMSLSEVVVILGIGPQCKFVGREGSDWVELDFLAVPAGTREVLMWSDKCDIWVYFDSRGRVIGRDGFGNPPPQWHERLRTRLSM